MPDYKKMYIKLFNKVTDVIEELQTVQKEMEELYVQSSDAKLSILQSKTKNPEK